MNVLGHKLFPVSFYKKACFVLEGVYNPSGGVKGALAYMQFMKTGTGVFEVKIKNVLKNTLLSPNITDGNFDFDYNNIISIENEITFFNSVVVAQLPMSVYADVDVSNQKIILYTIHRDDGLIDPPGSSRLQCRVFCRLNKGKF